MGMACTLRRVPEPELARLLALAPEDASAELRAEDEREMAEAGLAVRRVQPRNPLLRLLLRLVPVTVEEVVPESVPSSQPPGEEPRPRWQELDLEGVWHPLHFILTRTAWEGEEPACFLVRGGEAIGDDDDDQVRALRPDAVRRFAAHLDSLSRDALAQRHDAAAMRKLRIDGAPRDDVLDAFDGLRRFVRETADAGDGLLVRLA